MTANNDIQDLLGDDPVAKLKKGKPAAKKEAPAAKKGKPATTEKPPRVREPVVFEEGEKEALMKRIPKLLKNPISTKDLAAKLDIPTRKLRPVLYSMQRAGQVELELAASRAQGMTVSAAAG